MSPKKQSKRSEARRAAERRYDIKRRGRYSIPLTRLNADEAAWVDPILTAYPTKKEALLAALDALRTARKKKK